MYMILRSHDLKTLESEVERYLAQGWTLAGGVCFASGDWAQALTLTR
jgi:hypothetical protein